MTPTLWPRPWAQTSLCVEWGSPKTPYSSECSREGKNIEISLLPTPPVRDPRIVRERISSLREDEWPWILGWQDIAILMVTEDSLKQLHSQQLQSRNQFKDETSFKSEIIYYGTTYNSIDIVDNNKYSPSIPPPHSRIDPYPDTNANDLACTLRSGHEIILD
ncbi:hypothetical protein TNCV_2859371 [Trichonephila clavipes]|nr:hypothetical protein TNCV_2859371 [Trichonephila clavipes]